MNGETKVIGGIIALTVIILAGIVIFGGKTAPKATDSIKVDKGELVRDDSARVGTEGAKVTIVEFADFQCPACGSAHPVLKQIIDQNKDKMLFVHRNFPLSIHANAEVSARAAEAAGLQGKFWEMHNMLFEHQNEWSTSLKPYDIFARYAQDLGLNVDQFKSDIDSTKVVDKIRLDKGDGEALGVNSTPTLYINGQEYNGSVNAVALQSKINELLGQ